MEEILELARKVAEEAEVFQVDTDETPVHFEANRLKAIHSKQSSSVSLRIIKNGRLGYAAASGRVDIQDLVNNAVETAQFGQEARFGFPSGNSFPDVKILDPEVEEVSIAEMIELGQKMIDPLLRSNPGIVCEAGVSRETVSIDLINSKGGQARYRKSVFGLEVGGTLIRDTDMLFVGDGKESCRPLRDIGPVINTVLRQLELARDMASVATRRMPVIFTPDGLISALIPSLMAAFNGKIVMEGASPIGKRLGEEVFDNKLSLYDDALVEYAPHSRPCDDEGVPSQRTPLIENGVIRNFLYDLQTAGQAKAKTTGSGSRGRGGLISPSPSAFIINTGELTFDDMVTGIKEGLIIEQLMGAEQGNILGGDFSGNVLLGYKIENGKIVGRVKNTMVSGNIYQMLKRIEALGKESKWVGGALYSPHIYCSDVSVASK
jgi:PmbA protein